MWRYPFLSPCGDHCGSYRHHPNAATRIGVPEPRTTKGLEEDGSLAMNGGADRRD